MPYASNAELPPAVKDRYTDRCQSVFRRVFNDTDGDEETKFKVAHTAARNCMESTAGKALLPIKADPLDPEEATAWVEGKHPRRILVIPFGGPIPTPTAPLGADLDGEWFSERTDIFGGYKALLNNRERMVDWHHSYAPPTKMQGDPTRRMNGVIVGKAMLDEEPEEDGWWADLWIKLGDQRRGMIAALARRGAQLFGSSQAEPSRIKRNAKTGEILRWPMILETLTTTPQNTHSVVRPIKAVLDDFNDSQFDMPSPLKAWLADLDALGANLPQTFPQGGDAAATATRLLERIPDVLDAWGVRKQ